MPYQCNYVIKTVSRQGLFHSKNFVALSYSTAQLSFHKMVAPEHMLYSFQLRTDEIWLDNTKPFLNFPSLISVTKSKKYQQRSKWQKLKHQIYIFHLPSQL